MEDFVLLFRRDAQTRQSQPSPDEMQQAIKPWQDWMGGIAAQNKLVSSGGQLKPDGYVIKPGSVVTNGPYVDIKESLGGYIVIKANGYDDALEIAKGCPILQAPWNGSVEVREFIVM